MLEENAVSAMFSYFLRKMKFHMGIRSSITIFPLVKGAFGMISGRKLFKGLRMPRD